MFQKQSLIGDVIFGKSMQKVQLAEQNLSLKLVIHDPFQPVRRGVTMAPPKDLRLKVIGYKDIQTSVEQSKVTEVKS